jgi:L-fucose isomerase
MIRVGVLSFSDGRERIHRGLTPDIQVNEDALVSALMRTGYVEVVRGQAIVHNPGEARREAMRMVSEGASVLIFHISVFAFPNYMAIAANMARLPVLLFGLADPRYPGMGSLLATGASFEQIGLLHHRLWGNVAQPDTVEAIMRFVRGASAFSRLRGQVFGLVGGRSIGMYATGSPNAGLWMRKFGIDIEHVDQLELVRRAGLIDDARSKQAVGWLEKHVAGIEYDGNLLTPEKLDFQVRTTIALKDLMDDLQLDFAGVKCHFDMSEYQCTQCLSAAFVNDPYDWDGPKEPRVMACEADADGALTMQILKLISGGPSALLDLRYYDAEQGVFVFCNCGSTTTWYAGRSDDPEVNLSSVRLIPTIPKYAGGGAHVRFFFKPGLLTLARLTRREDRYRLVIARGNVVRREPGQVQGEAPSWPNAFIETGVAPEVFIDKMAANHMHVAAGDYVEELLHFCAMSEIEPVVLN